MIYEFKTKQEVKEYRKKVDEFSDVRWDVDYPIPEHPNMDYIKLGYHITDRIGKHLTAKDPEYYGLSSLLNDDQAAIVVKLKKRKHYTAKDIIKIFPEYTEEEMDKILWEIADIGVLEYHYQQNGKRIYWIPPFLEGVGEWSSIHRDRAEAHPERARFFERESFLPLAQISSMVAPGGSGVGMHVIPVEKEVENNRQVLPHEKISYYLDKYDKFALQPCVCRVARFVLDDNGDGDDPTDWCVTVGPLADYMAETGKGHYATREEVEEVLQKAEDNGYVHQVTNQDGVDGVFIICNCDVNSCYALRTSQLFNTPNLSRSAYLAKVNQDKCVACGGCVEVCPAGAVKLGQRLAFQDGHKPEYPVSDSANNHVIWRKEKWDIYYRDTARINCYDTGTAPCKTACPAHIAVEGYIKLARDGRYAEALELIKKENPFPAVCGRICNKRCEDACTRGLLDAPVAIDDIKRYVAELDLDPETRCIPKIVSRSVYGKFAENKVAIIGGGPAGLSCAFYLAKAGYKPVIFEKNDMAGGMMQYGIPAYKLQKDIVQAEIEVIRILGGEIRTGVEVGKDITIKQLREEGYEAFYIAIGCQGARRAGIPGEDAEGTDYAVNFLKSATENLDQKIDGDVVVVGGGNVAVDVARTAKRFGASKVTMLSLESREEMPASKDEVSETLADDIFIQNGWGPKEVLKDEKGAVKGVVFKKCLRTIDPATGKFSPEYDEEDAMTIPCGKVIFAIGQAIDWGTMLEGEAMEYVHGNYPKADPKTYQTSVPDIFVGGDVYHGPRFVIDAIADGKEGAESIHRFVQHALLKTGRNPRDYFEMDKAHVAYPYNYDTSGRQMAAKKPGGELDFHDTSESLTEGQVRIEASRCLQCGASYVDPGRCIGCGICTTKCMFDAIHLEHNDSEYSDMRQYEERYSRSAAWTARKAGKVAIRETKNLIKKVTK